MPLHPEFDQKLSQLFGPRTSAGGVCKGHDITFVPNAHGGAPVTLFFGKRRPGGRLAGERYARTSRRARRHPATGTTAAKSCPS